MWQIASGHQRRSSRPGYIPLNVLPFVWCDRGVCVAAYCWPDGGALRKVSFAGILDVVPGGRGIVSYSEYGNNGREEKGGVCGCFAKRITCFWAVFVIFRIQIMGYGVESNRNRNVVRDGCFVRAFMAICHQHQTRIRRESLECWQAISQLQ